VEVAEAVGYSEVVTVAEAVCTAAVVEQAAIQAEPQHRAHKGL
jgi:hypothetical protein